MQVALFGDARRVARRQEVRSASVVGAAGQLQDVRVHGVQAMVVAQPWVGQQRFDHVQRRLRTASLGHGDGAVQRDDRPGGNALQHPVERLDLGPVGGSAGCCFVVHRGDGSLQLVRPDPPDGERGLHQRRALGDLAAVPPRAVLLGERHECPVGVGARSTAGVSEQHEREEPGDLGARRAVLGAALESGGWPRRPTTAQ